MNRGFFDASIHRIEHTIVIKKGHRKIIFLFFLGYSIILK